MEKVQKSPRLVVIVSEHVVVGVSVESGGSVGEGEREVKGSNRRCATGFLFSHANNSSVSHHV